MFFTFDLSGRAWFLVAVGKLLRVTHTPGAETRAHSTPHATVATLRTCTPLAPRLELLARLFGLTCPILQRLFFFTKISFK